MLHTVRHLLRTPSCSTRRGPLVMGILNVTPDSFSDGGKFVDIDAALAQAKQMIDDGADIIDVGPESTRPGSSSVSAAVQCARAIPLIKNLRSQNEHITISIDTRIAHVAAAAISAGADWINDVSALRDDTAMAAVAVDNNATVILMHMRGCPADMQDNDGPIYDDVMGCICDFLKARITYATNNGIDPNRIVIDPGIGFGKRTEHNLTILRELNRLKSLEQPILVGASRKRFITDVFSKINSMQSGHGDDSDRHSLDDRLIGSCTTATMATVNGASILRVHDVRETVAAMAVAIAVKNWEEVE